MKYSLLLPFFFLVATSGSRAQTMNAGTDTPAPDAGSAAPPAQAQGLPRMSTSFSHKPSPTAPPSEISVPVAKFFNSLKAADYVNAYENFLGDSPLGEQKEKMSAFISRTQEAFGLYGSLHDYELYDNYPIGSNVIVLTYLTRHQRQPLRWRFIFYRPEKTWILTNMGFDDVLLDLLD